MCPRSPWISASRASGSSIASRSRRRRNTSPKANSRPGAWARRSRRWSTSSSTAGSTRSSPTSETWRPRWPARPGPKSVEHERGRIFPTQHVRSPSMAKVPKRWYEDFFGSDYLIRYVHPETPAQVEAIDKILHLRKGGRILDVACGAGRHTIDLAKRGYRVTGFDLSSPLLAEARKAARTAGVKPTFVQGDMRRLPYRNAFEAAISMFTSFGYFDRPEEDRQVLRGIARALRPRGKFLMELFNRDSLVARLPSQSLQARDDGTVVLEDASFDPLDYTSHAHRGTDQGGRGRDPADAVQQGDPASHRAAEGEAGAAQGRIGDAAPQGGRWRTKLCGQEELERDGRPRRLPERRQVDPLESDHGRDERGRRVRLHHAGRHPRPHGAPRGEDPGARHARSHPGRIERPRAREGGPVRRPGLRSDPPDDRRVRDPRRRPRGRTASRGDPPERAARRRHADEGQSRRA